MRENVITVMRGGDCEGPARERGELLIRGDRNWGRYGEVAVLEKFRTGMSERKKTECTHNNASG